MSSDVNNGDNNKQTYDATRPPPGVIGYYADSSVRSKVRPLPKQRMSTVNPCGSKARTVSSRPLLESVSESEDVSEELQAKFQHCSSDMKKNVSNKRQQPSTSSNQQSLKNEKHNFGVKSHLHHFYDSYQNKGQHTDDSEDYTTDQSGDEDSHYLIAPNKKKNKCCCGSTFSSFCWRTSMWSGLIIFIIGTIFILVGVVVPRKSIIVGHKIDIEIIDRSAQTYNSNLDLCRYIGVGLFCCGVAIITISLLLPSFIRMFYDADFGKNTFFQHQEPFKWKVGSLQPPKSPTEKIVPATEEVTGVQPKADVPKSVVLAQTGVRDLT